MSQASDGNEQMLWLAAITLVAATVNGALGYGFSSITVPLALLFLSNRVLNPALIIIEPVKGSRLVLIKIQDTRPEQARRLSDAVARAYIQQNLDKMVNATGDTVVWLSGQLDHFKQELEQTENSLHEFKKQNDLPSSTLEDLSKMIRLEMQEYDSALTRTRMRRSELTARHSELGKITAENPDQVPASELLSALERRGPERLLTLYQNAQDILPPGRSPNSVGPTLLSNPHLFVRLLPGVYGLHHQVPSSEELLVTPPPYLLDNNQLRLLALARRGLR